MRSFGEYRELKSAVVAQAVCDYKKAYEYLIKNPKNKKCKNMMKDCEEFFLSSDLKLFTDLDGEKILNQIKHTCQMCYGPLYGEANLMAIEQRGLAA